MSDTAVMDKPVGIAEPPTEAPKSAFDQFTGLFGIGKKPSVQQPTPSLNSTGLVHTTAPVQSPDITNAGLPTTNTVPDANLNAAPAPEVTPTLDTAIPATEAFPSTTHPTSEVAPVDSAPVDDFLAKEPQTSESAPLSPKVQEFLDSITEAVDKFRS